MIRSIAAIDEERGMANDRGIPWDLPDDKKYFVDKTKHGIILMGYGTYVEFDTPFHDRTNFVATSKTEQLRKGFAAVHDARRFLTEHKAEDAWNIGGAGLWAGTLDLTDELYITQLRGTYDCTKFFPEYKNDFELTDESAPHTQNGITYTFQVWKKKTS